MAWNPSPEVQVARSAAAAFAKIRSSPVNRCVVIYTTADDAMGYASYGANRSLCGDARRMADICFDAIHETWDQIDSSGCNTPPRAAGHKPDWDSLRGEVNLKIDMLRATFEKLPDGDEKSLYMRDIGLPLLEALARFCMSFSFEVESQQMEMGLQ